MTTETGACQVRYLALNEQQRKWIRDIRDKHECQFPYEYTGHKGKFQVHHIQTQRLGGKDDPLNLITLDERIHPGLIHPDVAGAKRSYYQGNKQAFEDMMRERNIKIRRGEQYYNDAYDEEFLAIAQDRTETAALDKQFFPRKHPSEYFIPEINPHVAEMVLLQHEHRRNWQENDNVVVVDEMLFHELQELDEAVTKAYIGDGAFEVASEIGDLGYLYVRRSQFEKPITEEISIALEYAHYVCTTTGIDMNEAIMMKCIRNDQKYLHTFNNNGYDYDKAIQLSKEHWKRMGGDSAFSEAYMMIGEEL